jgi:predicted  nucleic acid-binding Zn-ribbon protein
MNELEILKKKYQSAMQTIMESYDAYFTVKAQLDLANAEIVELKAELEKIQTPDIDT